MSRSLFCNRTWHIMEWMLSTCRDCVTVSVSRVEMSNEQQFDGHKTTTQSSKFVHRISCDAVPNPRIMETLILSLLKPENSQSIELFNLPTLMHNPFSLTICRLHYYPRHVSSINMPIFRRKNCIHTASGIVALELSERSYINII